MGRACRILGDAILFVFHAAWVVGCAIIRMALFLLKWACILIFLGKPGREN
jgi:hypothetical protein